MRHVPAFIGDDEREAARYGGHAEQAALSRRSGIGSFFHHKRSAPAEQATIPPPAQPAQPSFIDFRALVQQSTLGNPQAAAQLAAIKAQLGQRAAKGDMQSAALLQKIQGFEIQAAVAMQAQQSSPAAPNMPPGMPPGYGPPDGMPPDPLPGNPE